MGETYVNQVLLYIIHILFKHNISTYEITHTKDNIIRIFALDKWGRMVFFLLVCNRILICFNSARNIKRSCDRLLLLYERTQV